MIYQIYTDGGSRGNPGPGAIGVVIKNEDDEIIYEMAKYLGRCTNNEAEYLAVFHALKAATARDIKKILLHVDSELIAKQLLGEYKVKNKRLRKIFLKIKELENNFLEIKYKQIRRERNKNADALVNEALDKNGN
jgi:ribonuclease HI